MQDEFCTEIKIAPKKLYFGSETGYDVRNLVLHLVIGPNACMEKISLLLFYEKQSKRRHQSSIFLFRRSLQET